MFKVKGIVAALFAVAVLAGSGYGEEKKEEHHHHKAPHGGALLETGDEVAHVEFVHDEKTGKVTLYVLGSDAKTAMPIKDAPKLNLKTASGNKQLETKAVDAKDGKASQYEVTDEVLKAEPKGRVVVKVKDKKYNIDIKDAHDH